ncbi:MAG: helix-turn-helix domain-containing protein, partial [Clostridia bacterium]
ITPEEKEEIKIEKEIIEATIEARKQSKLSQRELSKKTGIKQPAIARIEKNLCSPKVSTLIKILHPIGFTIKVVPIEKNKID